MYEGEALNKGLGQSNARLSNYPSATTADAPPLGRVAEAEQENRKLLETLSQALQGLEQRISPVLRAQGPSGIGATQKEGREPSPFAGALIANNQKLYALIGYVQDLSARVDL